jgi:hypothetical protein
MPKDKLMKPFVVFVILLITLFPTTSAFSLRYFTKPDTILPNVYDPLQLNRYAYTRNNPVKYTDPSGNFICGGVCTLGAIIGLGTAGGGVIAGGIDLISQIWQGSSISEGTVDWNQVGGSSAIGATAGGTFAATFGLGSLALGGTAAGVGLSTATEIGLGAGSGIVAGRTAQLTYNEFNDRPLTENLFEPKSVATDAVLGGTVSGVARGIRTAYINNKWAAGGKSSGYQNMLEHQSNVRKNPADYNPLRFTIEANKFKKNLGKSGLKSKYTYAGQGGLSPTTRNSRIEPAFLVKDLKSKEFIVIDSYDKIYSFHSPMYRYR